MTHPITPPSGLVQEWVVNTFHYNLKEKLIEAARWGADQELEACCEWFVYTHPDDRNLGALRAARRPKPPSLKEQALGLLNEGPVTDLFDHEVDIIRRALEALPDDLEGAF